MKIKFLQPMALESRSGHRSFGVGEIIDLPELEASRLLNAAGPNRVKRIDEEFQILEVVLARKVSPVAFRGPAYSAPQWCRGVIMELDHLHRRAKISSAGDSEFWAAFSQLQKL